MKILSYIDAWNDAFDIYTQLVFRVYTIVCSEGDIVIVCVSCRQHFLEYISDSPNIREILKKEGYIPVQKEFLSDKMFVDYNPCMKDIENTILKAVVRKSDARYIENSWNLQKQLYMAICEKKAPPELKTIYKQQNQE